MEEFGKRQLNNRMNTNEAIEPLAKSYLIQLIDGCRTHCSEMITYILDREDVSSRRRQIKLLRDCESMCEFTSCQLAKGSFLSPSLLKLCAFTCDHCGRECGQFEDAMSKRCVYICLTCAKQCAEASSQQ